MIKYHYLYPFWVLLSVFGVQLTPLNANPFLFRSFGTPRMGNEGSVELEFKVPQNAEHKKIFQTLQRNAIIQRLTDNINSRLNLPKDIVVVFEDCGTENAFYSPSEEKITMCYELIRKYVSLTDDNISFEEKVLHATSFTLLHELGHALVHLLDIPITGKEESAVDEFAMILLVSSNNRELIESCAHGVIQFYHDALDEDLSTYPMHDEHPPSKERFFDMLTILLGATHESGGDISAYIGGEGAFQLNEDRAVRAPREYIKKLNAWNRLLADYWKPETVAQTETEPEVTNEEPTTTDSDTGVETSDLVIGITKKKKRLIYEDAKGAHYFRSAVKGKKVYLTHYKGVDFAVDRTEVGDIIYQSETGKRYYINESGNKKYLK